MKDPKLDCDDTSLNYSQIMYRAYYKGQIEILKEALAGQISSELSDKFKADLTNAERRYRIWSGEEHELEEELQVGIANKLSESSVGFLGALNLARIIAPFILKNYDLERKQSE